MTNIEQQFLQYLENSRTGREWVECMEDYIDSLTSSRVDYLEMDHTAFWITRGDTLLVAVETSDQIVSRGQGSFPTGWVEALENGWSYLLLCSERSERYPSGAAFDFLIEQKENGAFDFCKHVVVYGSQQATQAAFACASVFQGCTLLITQPEMTNETGVTNDLFKLSDLSGSRLIAAYDPTICHDFPSDPIREIMQCHELRCWHLGTYTDHLLRSFDVLPKMLKMASQQQVTLNWAFPLLRERRNLRYYWRSMLQRIDTQTKPKTAAMLCRNVVPLTGGRIFKQKLQELEQARD